MTASDTASRQATLTEAVPKGGQPAGETACPTCGRGDFGSVKGMKIHHSKAHGESIAGVEVECANCGEPKRVSRVHVENKEHHFCDYDCLGEWKTEDLVEVECVNCGDLVEIYPSHHKRRENHFCDPKCWGEWQSERQRKNREIVRCANCGEVKEVVPSQGKSRSRNHFCDRDCHAEWRRENWEGEVTPAWKGGKVEVQCSWCGTSKRVKLNRAERNEHHFCDPQCHGEWQSEYLRGEDARRWAGGYTNDYGPSFDPQRERALDRACGRCEMCGLDRESHRELAGVDLHAHHKTPFRAVEPFFGHEVANSLANLIMVCRSCHHKGLEPISRERGEQFVWYVTGLQRE